MSLRTGLRQRRRPNVGKRDAAAERRPIRQHEVADEQRVLHLPRVDHERLDEERDEGPHRDRETERSHHFNWLWRGLQASAAGFFFAAFLSLLAHGFR